MKTIKLIKIFEDAGLAVKTTVIFRGEIFTVATASVADPLDDTDILRGEGIARKSDLDPLNYEIGEAIAINRALMACYKKRIRTVHPIHSVLMG